MWHAQKKDIYIYIHKMLYVHIIYLCIHSPLCRFSLYLGRLLVKLLAPTTRDVFHSYPVDSSTGKKYGGFDIRILIVQCK